MPNNAKPSGAVLALDLKVSSSCKKVLTDICLSTKSPKSSTGVGTPAARRNIPISTTAIKLASRPAPRAANAATSILLHRGREDAGAADSPASFAGDVLSVLYIVSSLPFSPTIHHGTFFHECLLALLQVPPQLSCTS